MNKTAKKLISERKDKSQYQFYVVVEPAGSSLKLESGWDNMQEAKDMAKELPGYLNAKPVKRNDLNRMNLDPTKQQSWLKASKNFLGEMNMNRKIVANELILVARKLIAAENSKSEQLLNELKKTLKSMDPYMSKISKIIGQLKSVDTDLFREKLAIFNKLTNSYFELF